MPSVIYEGHVRHERHTPSPHRFRHRIFMMGIELSEIDTVFRNHWLWSTRRPSVAWLRRSDHPGDVSRPLEAEIRDRVEAQTGVRPTGEILLVTHLRYFGYVMNPVSFYLIRDERDRLETVVADVTNTPWGERHLYVLPTSNPDDDVHEFRFAKALHVSPFMPMDIGYHWRFRWSGSALFVHMSNLKSGTRLFDATMSLTPKPITSGSLGRVLIKYPAITVRIVFSIYWNAFRLWCRKTPFFPHPKHARLAETTKP